MSLAPLVMVNTLVTVLHLLWMNSGFRSADKLNVIFPENLMLIKDTCS